MRKEKAAKLREKKRTSQMIMAGVIAAIAIGVGVAVYSYVQSPPREANFGAVGSDHVHAAFALFVNGQQWNFSQPQYQVKSRYIHFEGGDGTTIHRHATGVDIGYLFESMKMKFSNICLTTDDGTQHCNDASNTLKFYVNGAANSEYNRYVLKDGDRMLLSYGPETPEQIQQQLEVVGKSQIRG